MTSKHVAVLSIAALLGLSAVVAVLLCGRNPLCAAPGVLPSIVAMAGSITTLAGTIAGGVFGHVRGTEDAKRGPPSYTDLPAAK